MSKLLLVDDEPKVLRALSAALELDHDIFTAQSANEAKELIGQRGPFDAVITDEVMPDQKGHDLLIWCQQEMPESKRIMLTGLPITAELKAKCGSVSDTRILSKPWNVPDIEQALNQEEPTELLSETADNPKILILDNTGRNKPVYTQAAKQLEQNILVTSSPASLMTQLYANDAVKKVMLNVEDDEDVEALLGLILIIRKARPAVHIVLATPAKQIRAISEIEVRSKFVSILVKPFLDKRLVSSLRTATQ